MKEIKERPILFSSTMVKAILDGEKTMTRRVASTIPELQEVADIGGYYFTFRDKKTGFQRISLDRLLLKCPYGKPGSRLWVRETFAHSNMPDGPLDEDCSIFYRADYFDDPHGLDGEKSSEGKYRKWKSSMFMPRWVSRIDLEITNIKIERLQDISEEDARREGMECVDVIDSINQDLALTMSNNLKQPIEDDRPWFAATWNSINAKRGYGWDTNPWVWAIEFKRVQP